AKARTEFRKRKNIDGQPMNLTPKFLIVSPEHETNAEQLIGAIYAGQSTDFNPFTGKLTLIVEPRLTSETRQPWYLAAEPVQVDTIEYAYLSGQEGVYIEQENNFMTDDLRLKARLDFGAGVVDKRGLYQ